MAASTKTITTAADLLSNSAKPKGTVKVEISSNQHKKLVDRTLNFRVGHDQSQAILDNLENKVKEVGLDLYKEATGADTSVLLEGEVASLKVVVKSVFTAIPIEHMAVITEALREEVLLSMGKKLSDELDEETEETVKEGVKARFDELFEVVTKVGVKTPSDAQLVYIDQALKLAQLLAQDPESLSDVTKSSARTLRRLQKEGAEIMFTDIFVSTRSINVLPIMAQRQFTIDPRIKALLKQQAPSISVAPKELAKVDVAEAIARTMKEVMETAGKPTASK